MAAAEPAEVSVVVVAAEEALAVEVATEVADLAEALVEAAAVVAAIAAAAEAAARSEDVVKIRTSAFNIRCTSRMVQPA